MKNTLFVGAVLTLAFLAGCTPTNTGGGKGPAKEVAVTTAKIAIKSLRRVIEQPASVEAYMDAPLVARIAGNVEKLHADIGDVVKLGQVLAELSVPELVKEHAQKQALVAQAHAEVEQAKAQKAEAEPGVARAEAHSERWESEHVRISGLYKSKNVEKQILDETFFQWKAAKAARLEAGAKVKKAEADIAVSVSRVLVAEAEEGRLKALADYRYIRAPFNGIVTRRHIHTGHFLQPNASGGPSVVFVIAKTDTLRIQAEIPETEAAYISDGLAAKIRIPALREQAFDGKVARTSVALDAKSRTLRTEIDFANKDGKLRPGMYANLIFTIDLPDRRVLPGSAIFTHADQPCCWRVVESKAVRTPLKLGVRDGQFVEVLKLHVTRAESANWEDITGQEEIVLTGLGSVTEGKAVGR